MDWNVAREEEGYQALWYAVRALLVATISGGFRAGVRMCHEMVGTLERQANLKSHVVAGGIHLKILLIFMLTNNAFATVWKLYRFPEMAYSRMTSGDLSFCPLRFPERCRKV